ncbi:hypothetical protein [Alkalibacillus haloalkaliphilus]|uniref:hypothetical protein n=1 Tax=Alkalibacillus haloalkaliphilus TaxID=94136 RepID=UPI00293661E0|nr:hypothetical protein [Alkalibacillus haloalkaliphilus]MDV2581404.1 hypothetical protein [Alkalibacillus haloalkaliphilus]
MSFNKIIRLLKIIAKLLKIYIYLFIGLIALGILMATIDNFFGSYYLEHFMLILFIAIPIAIYFSNKLLDKVIKLETKNNTLIGWLDELDDYHKLKEDIIGDEVRKKDPIHNLVTLKTKVNEYFNGNLEKLKLFKSLINGAQKDTKLEKLTTIFISLTIAFMTYMVTENYSLINIFMSNTFEEISDSTLRAYDITAIIFYGLFAIALLIKQYPTKKSFEIMEDVIDLCIEDIENQQTTENNNT